MYVAIATCDCLSPCGNTQSALHEKNYMSNDAYTVGPCIIIHNE